MSGIELKYLSLKEDEYVDRPEPVEIHLGGDEGPSSSQPSVPPLAPSRRNVRRSSGSLASRENDDFSGNGSRGGIRPEYLDMRFESCFRESKPVSTIHVIYNALALLFRYVKVFLYNFFVILLGFIIVLIWGVLMGFFSFYVNYVWNPSLRLVILLIVSTLPLATEPLRVLFSPFAETFARVFRQIRIQAELDGKLFDPVSDSQPLTGPQRYLYYIILAIVLVFLAMVNVFIFTFSYFVYDAFVRWVLSQDS